MTRRVTWAQTLLEKEGITLASSRQRGKIKNKKNNANVYCEQSHISVQQIFASVTPATHVHVWISNWRATLWAILWVCQKMCEVLPHRGRVYVSSHPFFFPLTKKLYSQEQFIEEKIDLITWHKRVTQKGKLHKYFPFHCLLFLLFIYLFGIFICKWSNPGDVQRIMSTSASW